jgi:hypothetical protein
MKFRPTIFKFLTILFIVVILILFGSVNTRSSASASGNVQQQREAEERVAQFADAVATFFASVEEKGWSRVLQPFINQGIDYTAKMVKKMLTSPEKEDV